MSTPTPTARSIALRAARLAARGPATVLALGAVQLLFFVALWGVVAAAFRGSLAHRPPPSLFEALALALSDPDGLRRLLIGAGAVGGLYFLGGAFLAGWLLARLRQAAGEEIPALRTAARRFLSLLILRVGVLGLAALVGCGAVVALPRVFERSLALSDERLQALALVAAALPVLVAALVCGMVLNYGQPLLLEGCRLRAVLGEALALIHRRPLATAGLYLGGWLAWAAVTGLGVYGLPAPVAALMRVVIHVWSYAAAWRAVRVWRSASMN